MQVRWSPQAAEDLAGIVAHLRKDDPAAAHSTAREIYERAGALKTFPHRGQGAGATRPGRIPHARRGRREYRTDVSCVRCRFAGPRKPLKISPLSLHTFVRMIPPPRTVLPERFMSALALSRPSRIVADRAA